MLLDGGADEERGDSSDGGSVSKEQRDAEEARWQLPETTLPGPATKGDVMVLTKARLLSGVEDRLVKCLRRRQGQGWHVT